MRETKSKTFVYKRAVHFPSARGQSLSELLKLSLNAAPTIGQRRQSLSSDEESAEWLVIGDHTGDASMLFGILMRYSPGAAAPTLLDDVAARRVSVQTFLAPKEGGKQREFIDGALFFAVAKNHVVLMQSASVRDRTLEQHLQWLLHETACMPGDHTFSLHDQPTRKARELAAASPVRNIELGGELLSPPPKVTAGEARGKRALDAAHADAGQVSAKVWEAIAFLLKRDGRSRLDLGALDVSKLSYSLSLRYEGRRPEADSDPLEKISGALRHAEGVAQRVHLDNGDILEGDQLRISGKVRIETRDGVPDPRVVFEKMRAWLLEKIGTNDID